MQCQCEEMMLSQCRPAWVCLCVRPPPPPSSPLFFLSPKSMWKNTNNNNNNAVFPYTSPLELLTRNLVSSNCCFITSSVLMRQWGFYMASTVWTICLPLFVTSPSPTVVIIQSNSTSTVQFPLCLTDKALLSHIQHHTTSSFPHTEMQYTDTYSVFHLWMFM